MTLDFLKQLMTDYRTYIYDRYGVLPAELPDAPAHYAHLAWMCQQVVETFDDTRTEKAMRWLGFVQGVFASAREFTLDDLRDHSRSDESHRAPKYTGPPRAAEEENHKQPKTEPQ